MKPLIRLRIKGPIGDFLILILEVCKSCGGPDSTILIIIRNAPKKTSFSMKEISVIKEYSLSQNIAYRVTPDADFVIPRIILRKSMRISNYVNCIVA